jgi:hypothetical protein
MSASSSSSSIERKTESTITKGKSGEYYIKPAGCDWTRFGHKESLKNIANEMMTTIHPSKNDKQNKAEIQLVDFGGVADLILGGRNGKEYANDPPKIGFNNAWIYSFMPANNKLLELPQMVTCVEKAGFRGTIIITQKLHSRGKTSLLSEILRNAWNLSPRPIISYYEDTLEVLEELVTKTINTGSFPSNYRLTEIESENGIMRKCKAELVDDSKDGLIPAKEGVKFIKLIWVRPPPESEFYANLPERLDRVVTITETAHFPNVILTNNLIFHIKDYLKGPLNSN